MGNCLVTKLKEAVNNNNLNVFNAIMFQNTENIDLGKCKGNVYRIDPGWTMKAIVGVFDVYPGNPAGDIVLADQTEFSPTEQQRTMHVCMKSANGIYALIGKNLAMPQLRNAGTLPSGGLSLGIKAETLEFSKINYLAITESKIIGTLHIKNIDLSTCFYISIFSPCVIDFNGYVASENVTTFAIGLLNNMTGAHVDMLKPAKNMTSMQEYYMGGATEDVGGDLKDLFDYWYSQGRTSGTLAIQIRGDHHKFTLNGEKVTSNKTITFSAGGWSVS